MCIRDSNNVGKGKCPIVDTWWQTETGGIMITSLANVTEGKPTFATKPMMGIQLPIKYTRGINSRIYQDSPWSFG